MHYCFALILLALSCALVNCVALPVAPQTPICVFDNYSKGVGEKSPRFRCETIHNVKFEIPWNSPSAKNMVATPFDDYVKLNAYYKKLFDVLESELDKRIGK